MAVFVCHQLQREGRIGILLHIGDHILGRIVRRTARHREMQLPDILNPRHRVDGIPGLSRPALEFAPLSIIAPYLRTQAVHERVGDPLISMP